MRVAIQGELGSNSHMAAREVFPDAEILSCGVSAEVFEALLDGRADVAVLPIENSLHGSVFEHYDLLLEHGVSVTGELLLRIRHNVIAAPGVKLEEVRRVMSHPVALSQCRRWLREHAEIAAVPAYDTAGSVKQLMAEGSRDLAGIAPELAAREYKAEVLVAGVEDHAENFTRFLVLAPAQSGCEEAANKLSVAFALEHRPGTLIRALQTFEQAGLNLTKIESRPVPGKPWEYVFFADVRFERVAEVEAAMAGMRAVCVMVKELGRYRAAESRG